MKIKDLLDRRSISLDGAPATRLFLIAAPDTEDNIHLDVLSKFSMMLIDRDFTTALRNAESVDAFLDIIDKADAERADLSERFSGETGEADEKQVKILAVTSCPTEIAHTYMAAEALEKAAKAANCFIKVETRGSGGAKNVLTANEIAQVLIYPVVGILTRGLLMTYIVEPVMGTINGVLKKAK